MMRKMEGRGRKIGERRGGRSEEKKTVLGGGGVIVRGNTLHFFFLFKPACLPGGWVEIELSAPMCPRVRCCGGLRG